MRPMRNTFVHPVRGESEMLFGIECDWCGLRQHGLTVTLVLAQGLADEHANECTGERG